VVVVPLGLRLAPLEEPYARRLLLAARILQPLGALAAIASFLVPKGITAAVLAAGWFVVCAVAGVAGLTELLQSRSVALGRLLPAAVLGFLAVGGAWLVGYSPSVVELTAVHFHYAGFAATLMSALAFATLRTRVSGVAGLLVVVGTPLTATGIATGTAALTVVGPILLATGLLTNAALTGLVIAPSKRAGPRWLLTISSLAVVVPMLLGVDYAAALVLPIPSLDLRTMAIVHGDLNAVLYGLIGLAGWSLV